MAKQPEKNPGSQTRQPSSAGLEKLREQKPFSLPPLAGWMAVVALVVLTLIFHSSILFGDHFLWEDFIEQEFPFRTLAATSLAHGIIPHWDPYIFGGMPFMADIQTAFWYPTNLLQSLFVSGGYLSPVVMEWFILLHYAVAGIGMFYFSKRLFDLDEWSALFAGIAYAFSGFIVAQAIHQMIVYQIAIFPFVALCFLRGFDSWKYAFGGGLLLATMYLAGHPQSTLYLTFFLACFAVYELVYRARAKDLSQPLSAAVVIRMALPVLIAVGIFAVQLLPSQELAGLSRREVMTFEKSVEGSISWGNLLTLILPRLFGVTDAAREAKVQYWNGAYYLSWETAIYIGIFPLFFGLIAAFTSLKRKYVPLLAGMSIFAILFSTGDHFFLYRIFFSLPLFNVLRTPARMMMVFQFAMSALAGLGLHEAMKATKPKWGGSSGQAVRGLILLVWVVALAGLISARSFLAGAAPEADESIKWAASLAALPVLALLGVTLAHYYGKLQGFAVGAIAIAVTIIELFNYGMSLNAGPEDPRTAFRGQEKLVEMLKQDQAKELSRARTRMGGQMLVKRNQGAYDKLQLIEGYNPLVLQRVSPETANPDVSADLMNIKWSILALPGNQVDFRERPSVLPRVKMYYSAVVKSDEDARAMLKSDASFDYRNKILLEEQPLLPPGPCDTQAVSKVTSYSENAISVHVKTASNGVLFLSEVYYPAWKAYVDGKPAKVMRAFTTLRAIEVPQGDHTVEMRYESDAFQKGSMISLVSLIVAVGGLAFFSITERKKHRAEA